MSVVAAGPSASQYLWFISRGSGLVLLVLFSLVIVLGVATRLGSVLPGRPRFMAAELHRTLSLFGIALLVLHIVTAILDPYVTIGWAATVLPFASRYRTTAIGFGTLAVDLAAAVVITSLARPRLGYRAWRAVHWLAYIAWPVAFVHSLTAGNDLHYWWVALIECGSAAMVTAAVIARLLGRRRPGPGVRPDLPQPGGQFCRAAMSADRVIAAADGSSRADRIDAARILPRLLPVRYGAGPASLAEHLARYGSPSPRPPWGSTRPQDLVAEVARAGLTGRGGAAFPTARKLAAVAASQIRPVVVVNGTEGEPASAKDKVLMATQPHLVLDGAAAAAGMVGARQIVFVAHAAVSEIIEEAIDERVSARLGDPRVRVVTAADGFVAGEASAVVNWVASGRPVPTPTPPRLAERGLNGRPTLVQNAETLAHLALIARYGADWFRALGTADEPGSMLVTVIGAVADPGVREVEIGIPVEDVLGQAGGPATQLSALLVGGYFGSWVRWPAAARLPFSAAGPRVPGCGTWRGPAGRAAR